MKGVGWGEALLCCHTMTCDTASDWVGSPCLAGRLPDREWGSLFSLFSLSRSAYAETMLTTYATAALALLGAATTADAAVHRRVPLPLPSLGPMPSLDWRGPSSPPLDSNTPSLSTHAGSSCTSCPKPLPITRPCTRLPSSKSTSADSRFPSTPTPRGPSTRPDAMTSSRSCSRMSSGSMRSRPTEVTRPLSPVSPRSTPWCRCCCWGTACTPR